MMYFTTLPALAIIGTMVLLFVLWLKNAGPLSIPFPGIWSIKVIQSNTAFTTFTAPGLYPSNNVVTSIDKLSFNIYPSSSSVITTLYYQTGYTKNYGHATGKPASRPAIVFAKAMPAALFMLSSALYQFLNPWSLIVILFLLLLIVDFNWLNSNYRIPGFQAIYRPVRSLSTPLEF